MDRTSLTWRKTYTVEPNDEVLDFLVGNINDAYFLGSIIWFKFNENRMHPSTEPAFKVVTKNLGDETEEGILNQFKSWSKENLKNKDYSIIEKEKVVF